MTNYYIEKDNKIIFVDTDLERLQSTIIGKDLTILETERPIVNFEFTDTDEYKEKKANENKAWFENNFFEIKTVGWIRKQFTMKNGSSKDFLFDAFPMVSALITGNQLPANSMVVYTLPDFYQEITEEYLKTLNAPNETLTIEQTIDFVTTCKTQIAQGFFGV